MKVSTSVALEESLRNKVAEMAALEQRSFSAMASLLLETGIAAQEEPDGKPEYDLSAFEKTGYTTFEELATEAVVAKAPWEPSQQGGLAEPEITDDRSPDQPSGSASVLPSKPGSRKGVCVHRNPPGTWCRWCDA